MAKNFPLTRKQFGNFIATAHGSQFRRGDNDRCPLTRAVQAYRPKAKNDTGERVTISSYDNLPKWALDFMGLYDGTSIYGDTNKPLSAYAAAVKVGAIR